MTSSGDPAASGAAPGPADAAGAGERLWLSALQEIGRRSGHEVRNALNGVAVNLEVVRARAARAGDDSVSRFADTAAEQLEGLTRLTEALVGLLRPAPEPLDLVVEVDRLVAILGAAARADGGEVAVERRGPDSVRTPLPADVARPLLAGALLGAGARSARLCCEVDGEGAPTLRLTRRDEPLPQPPAELAALAEVAGVRADWRPDGWTMIFPPMAG